MSLNSQSNRQLPNIPKWIIPVLVILGLAGFVDSSYLTVMYFLNQTPACTIINGCEAVTNSVYSDIAGIPVAMLGLLFYTIVILSTIAYVNTHREGFLKLISFLSIFGFLMSIWLTYSEVFVIKAICLYCLVSAIVATLIFIVGLVILTKYHKSLGSLENNNS